MTMTKYYNLTDIAHLPDHYPKLNADDADREP